MPKKDYSAAVANLMKSNAAIIKDETTNRMVADEVCIFSPH